MKRRFLIRRGLAAGAFLAVAGGGLLIQQATPAGASTVQVTAAGSFTTYVLMHNIFGPSLNDLMPGGNTSHQVIAATPKLCKTGVDFTGSATGAPNGSGAGKKYLHNEESAAVTVQSCVDFGRSSSPPKHGSSTVSTHFDYYAYAMTGVAPLVGTHAGGSRSAPVELTLTQVKNIYLCKPGYTNWKTLTGTTFAKSTGIGTQGGVTAPVVRFWPQPGSGTRTVYGSILGFTPETLTGTTGTLHGGKCAHKPTTTFHTVTVTGTKKSVVNEENSEQGIIYTSSLAGTLATATPVHTTVPHATAIKDAIYNFAAGHFVNDWNNTSYFGKSKVNSIDNKSIGNWNATTLLLAKVKSRTETTYPTKAFVIFGAQTGTFTGTSNRGTFSVNTVVVKEANEWFTHIPTFTGAATTSKAPIPGVRYVWNVADTYLPTYSEAKMTIGFDNQSGGDKSALCHGDDSAAIIASGFVPLNNGSTSPKNDGGGFGTGGTKPAFGGTMDVAGAYCREAPGKSYPDYGGRKHWATQHTPTTPTKTGWVAAT